MTSSKFLVLGIIAALLIAAVILVLPDGAASNYAEHGQPIFMFMSAALALSVAGMYRGDMRRVFLLLTGFLFFYGLFNISWLVDQAFEVLDEQFFKALLAYQIFSYAFLLGACIFILRVVSVPSLSSGSRIAVGATVLFGVAIVVNSFDEYGKILDINAEIAVSYLLIRIFDVLIMAALVPVLAMYVQNARSQYQESASFAVIGAAIIASLTLVYAYEFATNDSLWDIAEEEGSTLDFLFLFGYLSLIVGLLVHRLHQVISYRRLDGVLRS
ncbi:MAG: hypothetical protein HQ478_10045 [Chloroflexi bacterium]|nr:hypothetical protein [Chloroflexota bacterium]